MSALSRTYVLIIELYQQNDIASLTVPRCINWRCSSECSQRTTKSFFCDTQTSRLLFPILFSICLLNSRRKFFFLYYLVGFFVQSSPHIFPMVRLELKDARKSVSEKKHTWALTIKKFRVKLCLATAFTSTKPSRGIISLGELLFFQQRALPKSSQRIHCYCKNQWSSHFLIDLKQPEAEANRHEIFSINIFSNNCVDSDRIGGLHSFWSQYKVSYL